MLLALAIGSGGGVPLAAQEAPQGAPPLSSPGVVTPRKDPDSDPDPAQRRSGARRQRGRDAAVFSVQGSLGTNGGGGTTPVGVRSPLVGARVVSDFSTRLTLRPVVSPVSWQLTGDMGYRGYDVSEFMSMGRSVGTSAAWRLGSRTQMSASASASYQPIFSLYQSTVSTSAGLAQFASAQATATATGRPILPTASIDAYSGALPASLDFGAARSPAYAGNALFSAGYRITSRISVNGSLDTSGVDFKAERNRDSKHWGASGRVSYALLNGIGVHAGYGRRVVGYYRATGLEEVVLDNLDIGLDVTRGFSLTKKGLTLAAQTGSIITTDGNRRQIHATGKVDLTQALGRSAGVSAGFQRSAQLPPGFVRPVFTDAFVVGAGGEVSRAASWLVSVSRSIGTLDRISGLASGGAAYHTSTGTARVSVPLSQRAGLYIEYMAYQHDINQGVDVLDVLRRRDLRQMGRIGFSLDVPLLRDTRRPRRERP